ncbi:MAG: VanZ family protein [Candidatus Marinimicrobia bacterium]|nr:VanZ family protein [Candidatus Neomarinimicrobiota bacterium]
MLFGAMDEYLQSFISGRYSSGWDVLADTIGVIIGALLVLGNGKK